MINYINPYRFKPSSLSAYCDSYYDKVLLLLEMSGSSGSTTFTDTGPWARAVTRTGSVAITNLYGITNGVSAFFDGNNDYLSTSLHDVSAIGTKDFTIEMWINRAGETVTGGNNVGTLLDLRTTDPAIQINLNVYGSTATYANKVAFYVNGLDRIISDTAISTGTWYHVALVRTNSITEMYINGIKQSMTYVDANTYSSTTVRVGGRYAAVSSDFRSFNGYIDSLRISDISRYNQSIATVQTIEFSNTDIYWANTVLLMHMNGANASTTFTDSSPLAHTITRVGDTKISTAQSKFGGASAYFDGTGDYLTIPASSGFQFTTGDFTIEAWIYLPSTPSGGYAAIVDIRGTASGVGAVLWAVTSSQTLRYYSDVNIDSSSTIGLATWTHVALVRSANIVRMFINGALASSPTSDTSSKTQNPTVYIGRVYDNANPAFSGYIDELRITKGVARYPNPANVVIVPNTLAFPVQECNSNNILNDATVNLAPIAPYQNSEIIWSATTNQANIGAYQNSEIIWSATTNQANIGLYQSAEVVYSQTVNAAPITIYQPALAIVGTNSGTVPVTDFTTAVLYAANSITIPILAKG